MCDVSKYTKVYEDFKNLHSDDFLQLITEAETPVSYTHLTLPTNSRV